MLTREENELVCRVGPGTPMGEVMRRYWLPACTSAELPRPDSDPVRVRLVGESFVAFRDSDGRVGVLDELCMHRGASLALGRVEDCGIRCLYHGWKFGVDGAIQETPNHPDERFRERFSAPAYPVREEAGLVWVYLGAREKQPPFPTFPFMTVADTHRTIIRVDVPANYLQLIEGGIDSSHVGILHGHMRTMNSTGSDLAPDLEIEDTDFGFHYAAVRRRTVTGDSDKVNIRLTPFIMPFGRIIPAGAFTVFEVPADDESSHTYLCVSSKTDPVERDRVLHILGLDDERAWRDGDFQYRASWENGFFQDRAGMRSGQAWTGFRGVEVEDCAVTQSMGRIFDRSREHVVPADRAVIHARRLLLDSVRRVQSGEDPIGVGSQDLSQVVAPDVDIPTSVRWQDVIAPAHVRVGTREQASKVLM